MSINNPVECNSQVSVVDSTKSEEVPVLNKSASSFDLPYVEPIECEGQEDHNPGQLNSCVDVNVVCQNTCKSSEVITAPEHLVSEVAAKTVRKSDVFNVEVNKETKLQGGGYKDKQADESFSSCVDEVLKLSRPSVNKPVKDWREANERLFENSNINHSPGILCFALFLVSCFPLCFAWTLNCHLKCSTWRKSLVVYLVNWFKPFMASRNHSKLVTSTEMAWGPVSVWFEFHRSKSKGLNNLLKLTSFFILKFYLVLLLYESKFNNQTIFLLIVCFLWCHLLHSFQSSVTHKGPERWCSDNAMTDSVRDTKRIFPWLSLA